MTVSCAVYRPLDIGLDVDNEFVEEELVFFDETSLQLGRSSFPSYSRSRYRIMGHRELLTLVNYRARESLRNIEELVREIDYFNPVSPIIYGLEAICQQLDSLATQDLEFSDLSTIYKIGNIVEKIFQHMSLFVAHLENKIIRTLEFFPSEASCISINYSIFRKKNIYREPLEKAKGEVSKLQNRLVFLKQDFIRTLDYSILRNDGKSYSREGFLGICIDE